jgi:ABC-type uncharacterized transport system permease subunit
MEPGMNPTLNPTGKPTHGRLLWGFDWRLATLKNGMKDALAYRGEFILGLVGSAIVPIAIQIMLWSALLGGKPDAQFAGMTYGELMAYTWTSLLFSQIRGGDYDFELIEMIRTGSLSNSLLKPVGVVEFIYFKGLGEKLITTLVSLGLGLIACAFTSMTTGNLLMALILALLGNVIAYLFGAALSAVAFYWENAFAVLMVKNMVVALLCGELIPLSIVPEAYAWIWRSTPFYLFVYGPSQVALGKWGPDIWLKEMGIGLLWTLGLWAAVRISWKFSINRYQGIGG